VCVLCLVVYLLIITIYDQCDVVWTFVVIEKKNMENAKKKKLSWLRLVPVAHIHTDRLRVIWYDVWYIQWLDNKLFSRENSLCSRRHRITDYRERITQIYIYIMIVYYMFKKIRCWNVPEASGLMDEIHHLYISSDFSFFVSFVCLLRYPSQLRTHHYCITHCFTVCLVFVRFRGNSHT